MIVYIVTLDIPDHGGSRIEILAVCATRECAEAEALREAAKRWDVDKAVRRRCDPLFSRTGAIDIEEYEVLP